MSATRCTQQGARQGARIKIKKFKPEKTGFFVMKIQHTPAFAGILF